MPRYVAFLRGINVGGHTVKNDQLRAIVSALGFTDVDTFIASGNVIFSSRSDDAAAHERKISKGLQAALGYAVATFVRSLDEVRDTAGHEPFEAAPAGPDRFTTYVILLAEPVTAASRKQVLACCSDVDELAVKGREIYWRCRGSMLDSPFIKKQPRDLAAGTMRNRNTVVRLASKFPADSQGRQKPR